MVKGISRQVIVLQSPQTAMFEQAIFILKDGTPAVTDAQLLKEAERLVNSASATYNTRCVRALWTAAGALSTGLLWLLTVIL